MNEKPPILSEDDFESAISRRRISIVASPTYHKIIATAQRDADITWISEEIEKVENPYSGKSPTHYDPLQTEEVCMAEKRVFAECKQEILALLK